MKSAVRDVDRVHVSSMVYPASGYYPRTNGGAVHVWGVRLLRLLHLTWRLRSLSCARWVMDYEASEVRL
jgi:hypothetical protein